MATQIVEKIDGLGVILTIRRLELLQW